MKQNYLSIILPVLILTIILAGCGNAASPAPAATLTPESVSVTPTVSKTPDPCLPPQIEVEVQKVQKHMREFDDASTLASNVPQPQLSVSIADLQRIRREAEDEQIPACLTDLRTYQVQHMNSVISTLIAFMRSSDPQAIGDCTNTGSNPEAAAICQNIALARQQHDQYLLEIARVLGLTVVPATTEAADSTQSETPTP